MTKHTLRALLVLGPSLALVGCGGGEQESGTTIVIDASQMVMFPPDEALKQIQHVVSDPTGEVWVLQRTEQPHVFRYSSGGELIDTYGPTGPARGQLSNPLWLMPGDDASQPMMVWDAGNRRVVKYDQRGRVADVPHPVQRSRAKVYAPIQEHSYGQPLQIARFGGGYVLEDHPTDLATTGDYLHSKLLRLDMWGNRIEYLMDFGNEYAEGIKTLGQFADLLVPIPLWTTCPNGEMALFDPFSYRLSFRAPDGTVTAVDSAPVVRRPITEEDQRNYLGREMLLRWQEQRPGEPVDGTVIKNSIDNFLLRYANRFTELGPAAVRMMCAAERQIWLEEFNTADDPLGFGNRWLVHDPGQTEMIRVQFPPRFVPWEVSADGRVLGSYFDAQGNPVVAHVQLPPLEPAAVTQP